MNSQKTILSFTISGNCVEAKEALKNAENEVIDTVNSLISACNGKFCDPDFGPKDSDKSGLLSLYRTGTPPDGYIPIGNVDWLRPNYEGIDEKEKESICEDGRLFCGSHSAGDVNQGSLGDCWFLSAIAVVAEQPNYLENIFLCKRKGEEKIVADGVPEWKSKGVWVCRFNQNFRYHYVIIDDRLPVNKKSRRLIFGHCENPKELWVPLIEKAYAKLEGSYDSLIGGFIDTGLRDLTGLCADNVVFDKSNSSYSPNTGKMIENGGFYKLIEDNIKNGSLLGCSISPKPGQSAAVEGDAGNGLIQRHAYSILGVFTIKADGKDTQLIVLRNPWGQGEWRGTWSDSCPKKEKYQEEIKKAWISCERKKKVSDSALTEVNKDRKDALESKKESVIDTIENICGEEDNGLFLMSFADWCEKFSLLYACINFPNKYRGFRISGKWDKSGGNFTQDTWKLNPKYEFEVNNDNTTLHIQLSQKDLRYEFGKDYNKRNLIIGFHILPGDFDFTKSRIRPPKTIPGTSDGEWEQPIYTVQDTNSMNIHLNKGKYIIIASTFEKNQVGDFTINIYTDDQLMYVEGSRIISEEEEIDAPVIPPHEKREYVLGDTNEELENARDYYISKIPERGINVDEVLKNYQSLPQEEKEKSLSKDEFVNELNKIGFTNDEDKSDGHVVPLSGKDGVFQISDLIELLDSYALFNKLSKTKNTDDDDVSANGSVTDIGKIKKVIKCSRCSCFIDISCDKCNECPVNLCPSFAHSFNCEKCDNHCLIVCNREKPSRLSCLNCKFEFKLKKKGTPCLRCKCGVTMSLKCPSCHKFSNASDIRVPAHCQTCDTISLVTSGLEDGWKCHQHSS